MNFEKIMREEKTRLEKSIQYIQTQLENSPDGVLQIHKAGNSYNWYRVEKNKKRKYIPKSDSILVSQLAKKGLLKAELADDTANLRAVKMYLKHFSADEKRNAYLSRSPEHARLTKSYAEKFDAETEEWLLDKYTGTVPESQHLRIMSDGGFYVRSKSEQMIVTLLEKYELPYKYEQHLVSNGRDIFPDFMIMHPRTHEIYIWEHMGMMDNYKYREHNLAKIEDYCAIGFVPGENLILTFETKDSGFDQLLAEQILQHYFT